MGTTWEWVVWGSFTACELLCFIAGSEVAAGVFMGLAMGFGVGRLLNRN